MKGEKIVDFATICLIKHSVVITHFDTIALILAKSNSLIAEPKRGKLPLKSYLKRGNA